MKYQLTFCDIEQLSDNVFEGIPKEGVKLDRNCFDEYRNFWEKLQDKPFGLLINCEKPFLFSFEGSKNASPHPLQQKTAILLNTNKLKENIKAAVKIKKLIENNTTIEFFTDREEAILWLSAL